MLDLLVFFILGVLLKNKIHDSQPLFILLYYIIYPAAIIVGLSNVELDFNLIVFPLTYTLIGLTTIHSLIFLNKWIRLSGAELGAAILSLPVVNSGVIYSLGYSLGGLEGLSKAVIYSLGDIIIIPYSQIIASRYSIKSITPIKSIIDSIFSPITLSIIISVVLIIFNLSFPNYIVEIFNKIAVTITPIVMITLGLNIDFTHLFNKKLLSLFVLKIILGLVIIILVSIYFELSLNDIFLLTALSIASLGFVGMVISKELELDIKTAGSLIFISIIATLILSIIYSLI